MYVYIRSEPQLYTVGFYDPNNKWQPESDWDNTEDVARRVAWLNGNLEGHIRNFKENFDGRVD